MWAGRLANKKAKAILPACLRKLSTFDNVGNPACLQTFLKAFLSPVDEELAFSLVPSLTPLHVSLFQKGSYLAVEGVGDEK